MKSNNATRRPPAVEIHTNYFKWTKSALLLILENNKLELKCFFPSSKEYKKNSLLKFSNENVYIFFIYINFFLTFRIGDILLVFLNNIKVFLSHTSEVLFLVK